MTDQRREWDERVEQRPGAEKVAADLGLRKKGRHFFCPGCQPDGLEGPEMVIKKGHFQCFRCGVQGDVVGLVKLARQCGTEEAIAWLEKEAGAAES